MTGRDESVSLKRSPSRRGPRWLSWIPAGACPDYIGARMTAARATQASPLLGCTRLTTAPFVVTLAEAGVHPQQGFPPRYVGAEEVCGGTRPPTKPAPQATTDGQFSLSGAVRRARRNDQGDFSLVTHHGVNRCVHSWAARGQPGGPILLDERRDALCGQCIRELIARDTDGTLLRHGC